MIVFLYAVAALLLIGAMVTEGPFVKTDLIVFAAASFLLARFVRIERRLDKIEGVERKSPAMRALSWIWSKRAGLMDILWVVLFFALLWYYWESLDWQSIWQTLALISPEAPHPALHAFFGSSRAVAILFVWLPLGCLVALFLLSLVAFYAASIAILLGVWAPKPQRTKPPATRAASSRREQIVYATFAGFVFWSLFVMYYAKQETDAFFALFPDQQMGWVSVTLLLGWMPLACLALFVHRRRSGEVNIKASIRSLFFRKQKSEDLEADASKEFARLMTSEALMHRAVLSEKTRRLYGQMVSVEKSPSEAGALGYELVEALAEESGKETPKTIPECIRFLKDELIGFDTPEAKEQFERARLEAIKNLLR